VIAGGGQSTEVRDEPDVNNHGGSYNRRSGRFER